MYPEDLKISQILLKQQLSRTLFTAFLEKVYDNTSVCLSFPSKIDYLSPGAGYWTVLTVFLLRKIVQISIKGKISYGSSFYII